MQLTAGSASDRPDDACQPGVEELKRSVARTKVEADGILPDINIAADGRLVALGEASDGVDDDALGRGFPAGIYEEGPHGAAFEAKVFDCESGGDVLVLRSRGEVGCAAQFAREVDRVEIEQVLYMGNLDVMELDAIGGDGGLGVADIQVLVSPAYPERSEADARARPPDAGFVDMPQTVLDADL